MISHYRNVAVDAITDINAGNVSSSLWLIGAFNPLVGGSTTGLDNGNDYVKLKSIAADITSKKVPEPTSLLLVGLGLAAASRFGRRNRA